MAKKLLKQNSMLKKTANLLVIVGGINWGAIAVGNLMDKSLNLVTMLASAVNIPQITNIAYIAVGASALAIGYDQYIAKK